MIAQATQEGFEVGSEFEAEEGLKAAVTVGFYGVKDAVLNKTYLKNLQDGLNMINLRNPEEFGGALEKIVKSGASRIVPMAGTNRVINETMGDAAPQALTWADEILRAIPGARALSSNQIDALGDPVKSKEMGVRVGVLGRPGDDVKARIRDLGVNLPNLTKRSFLGIELTGVQLERLRIIRGHEATDAEGRTLSDALGELLDSDEFALVRSKGAQETMIRRTINSFNRPAKALLIEEFPDISNRLAIVDGEEDEEMGAEYDGAPRERKKTPEEEFLEYINKGER